MNESIWIIIFHVQKWATAINASFYGYCLKTILICFIIHDASFKKTTGVSVGELIQSKIKGICDNHH